MSTPSEDPVEAAVAKNNEEEKLCEEMFEKIVAYVGGELSATTEDYGLLKKLNEATSDEYVKMAATANGLNSDMSELRQKYEGLLPYLTEIDAVTESVEKLAVAAKDLDAYSKRLEARFKQLDKR